MGGWIGIHHHIGLMLGGRIQGYPHNMGAWRCAVEAFVSEASLSRQQCVIRKTHLSQPVQSTNSRKISDTIFLSYWSDIFKKNFSLGKLRVMIVKVEGKL